MTGGEHDWSDGRCRRCLLEREEAWFLDGEDRPVMALVWTRPDGRMRVRPFAFMRGLQPAHRPVMTVAAITATVPIGTEPQCVGPAPGGSGGR